MVNEDKLRRVIEEALLKHHKCHFVKVRNVDKYMVCPYCGKKINKPTGRIIKEWLYDSQWVVRKIKAFKSE